MARKRTPAPVEIEASRIVLRDAKGNVRILLDAGDDDGQASVALFAKDGRGSLWAATPPGGDVVLSFAGVNFDGMVTLSAAGITLRARDGRLGVMIGRVDDGTDSITVFRDGQPVWRVPALEKPSRRKRRRPKA